MRIASSEAFTMLLKIILCILSIAVLQLHAQQTVRDHPVCRRLIKRCEAAEPRLRRNDDVMNAVNEYCAQVRGRSWRNLTRCQFTKAGCRGRMNTIDGSCVKVTCTELARYSR